MSTPTPYFQVYSESYYAELADNPKPFVEEILISDNTEEHGELIFRWYDLRPGNPPSPKLEAFDDSWPLLTVRPELLRFLSLYADKDPTPRELRAYLLACGYEDATRREDPYKK